MLRVKSQSSSCTVTSQLWGYICRPQYDDNLSKYHSGSLLVARQLRVRLLHARHHLLKTRGSLKGMIVDGQLDQLIHAPNKNNGKGSTNTKMVVPTPLRQRYQTVGAHYEVSTHDHSDCGS